MNLFPGHSDLHSSFGAAPVFNSREIPCGEHALQLYESEETLVASVAAFVGGAVGSGECALVIATKAHCDAIDIRLLTHGLSVAAVKARKQLTTITANELVNRCMSNGIFDEDFFRRSTETLLSQLSVSGKTIHIFSELGAVLYAAGNASVAWRLESIWNELMARCSIRLLSAYSMTALENSPRMDVFAGICKEHNRFIPGETYSEKLSSAERLREICLLQQAAVVLQQERRARELADAALKEEHSFLQMALAVGELGSWEFQLSSARLVCSIRAKAILGLRQFDGSDIKTLLQTVYPDDRARAESLLEAAIADAKGYEDEFRVLVSNGQQRWMRIACRYSVEGGGTIVGLVRDITHLRDGCSEPSQEKRRSND